MNCEICNNPFNLSNGLSLTLSCCGANACKQCIMKLPGDQQYKGFTCPIQCCKQPNQDQNTLKTNKKVEQLLQQPLGILCDKHLYSQAEYFCHTHNTLVCSTCTDTTHQGHQCEQVYKQQLINYNNKILVFLKIELQRIKIMISEIEGYQQNENQFTNGQYLNILNDALATLKPRLSEQQYNDIIFPKFKLSQQYQEEEKKLEQQHQQNISRIRSNNQDQVIQNSDYNMKAKEEQKKQKLKGVQQRLPQQQKDLDSKLIKKDDYVLLKKYLNTSNLKQNEYTEELMMDSQSKHFMINAIKKGQHLLLHQVSMINCLEDILKYHGNLKLRNQGQIKRHYCFNQQRNSNQPNIKINIQLYYIIQSSVLYSMEDLIFSLVNIMILIKKIAVCLVFIMIM